ncbi:MAG: His/Gly/Thr/Pro-type tRNA ligase C-terminal domain-containing protein, partial [Nanoarchaeota archaeon]
AYRNEISPRQYIFRMREFTQAEAQLFIQGETKNDYAPFESVADERVPALSSQSQEKDGKVETLTLQECISKGHLKNKAYAWALYHTYDLFVKMGVPGERIRLRQHLPTERAFYAEDAWDIEINFNTLGWSEVCGVHDRTDYDLKQHETFSKKQLTTTLADGTKVRPHVIEIAFGVDRPLFALLDLYYDKKDEAEGKTMFRIPYAMSPIHVAVLPLMKKDDLVAMAKDVHNQLATEFTAKYDETQSIGKRYLRANEDGIPLCVTVDYDSLANKDVTIRDRDSEKQIRVPVSELAARLRRLINGDEKITGTNHDNVNWREKLDCPR